MNTHTHTALHSWLCTLVKHKRQKQTTAEAARKGEREEETQCCSERERALKAHSHIAVHRVVVHMHVCVSVPIYASVCVSVTV